MEETTVLDPAIADFFAERKQAWLKKNISTTMQEWEVHEKEQECEQNFLLTNWLPDAAKRLGKYLLHLTLAHSAIQVHEKIRMAMFHRLSPKINGKKMVFYAQVIWLSNPMHLVTQPHWMYINFSI